MRTPKEPGYYLGIFVYITRDQTTHRYYLTREIFEYPGDNRTHTRVFKTTGNTLPVTESSTRSNPWFLFRLVYPLRVRPVGRSLKYSLRGCAYDPISHTPLPPTLAFPAAARVTT